MKTSDISITKAVNTALLLDAYRELLAGRQRECLSLFYEEDWSLAEIGESLAISRQAAHDAIRHGEAQLRAFEEQLHLVEKAQQRQLIIAKLKDMTGHNSRVDELLDQLS